MTSLLRRCATQPDLVRFIADVSLLGFALIGLVLALALG